jgi:hypothetical protein
MPEVAETRRSTVGIPYTKVLRHPGYRRLWRLNRAVFPLGSRRRPGLAHTRKFAPFPPSRIAPSWRASLAVDEKSNRRVGGDSETVIFILALHGVVAPELVGLGSLRLGERVDGTYSSNRVTAQ